MILFRHGSAVGLLLSFLIARTTFPEPLNMETSAPFLENVSMVRSDMTACMNNMTDFFGIAVKPRHYAYQLASTIFWIETIGSLGDRSLRDEMQIRKSPQFDDIIEPWEAYGGNVTPVVVALSLYTGGAGLKNEWLRETGRECIMSLSLAALISTTAKIAIGRTRPFTDEGPGVFKPFAFRNVQRSFPSGHTTAAFALSSVLSARINNAFASVLLYGIAALTGAQRIYSNNHWLTDVIAGGVIGTVTGRFIVQSSLDTDEKYDHLPVRFSPVACESATGVGLTYVW